MCYSSSRAQAPLRVAGVSPPARGIWRNMEDQATHEDRVTHSIWGFLLDWTSCGWERSPVRLLVFAKPSIECVACFFAAWMPRSRSFRPLRRKRVPRMARKRVPPPSEATSVSESESAACLRLHNRTPTDWAFDAEGLLPLFDPSVVTDEVFDKCFGLQTDAPAALGWMTGNRGNSLPIVAEPRHWRAHGRARTRGPGRPDRPVGLGMRAGHAAGPRGVERGRRPNPFRAAEPRREEDSSGARSHAQNLRVLGRLRGTGDRSEQAGKRSLIGPVTQESRSSPPDSFALPRLLHVFDVVDL